jgi:hypothetical protein
MRWPLAFLCGLTLAALAGCGQHVQQELLESELRARDQDLRELRDELDRSNCYNRALQVEMGAMHGDYSPIDNGFPGGPPPLFPLRTLTLGRGTGGYDATGCPGDTALQVVLEPRDCDNHVIKVPASALIQVLEITTEGTKKPLSAWEVPPEQLRTSWRSGLLNNGFDLVLPWKVYPSEPKLRVVASLRLPNGRVFEADKDVTVKLVPPAQRHAPSKGAADDPLLPAPNSENQVPPEPLPISPKPGPGPGPTLPPMAVIDRSGPGWNPPRSSGVEMLKPVLLPD